MKPKHVANYYKAYGLSDADIPLCQKCGKQATDIHHIQHRQKNNPALNEADNLIALCRDCHTWVHSNNNWETKQKLLDIVKDKLNG